MRRQGWYLAVALLAAASIVLLAVLPVGAQVQGPPGPPANCVALGVATPSMSLDDRTFVLPAGVNLVQVQFSDVQFASSSASAYIDVRAVTSSTTSILLVRLTPSSDFVSAYLRLPSNTQAVRVDFGFSASATVSLFRCVQPDMPFGTYPDASQCTRIVSATQLTRSTVITLPSTGLILLGRVSQDYRTTYYANSPGPLIYDGFFPRLSASTFYDQYNVLGPLPAGSYEIVYTADLTGLHYAAYTCNVAVPTPTQSPLDATATAVVATATSLALTATAMPSPTPTAWARPIRGTPIAVAPVDPVVRPVEVGIQPVETQCTEVVPAIDLTVPGTDTGFQWAGFQVCTQSYGFTLRYGDVDLAPIVIGALVASALWSFWSIVRRG